MSELDINFVKDGQRAIATIAQSGDIVSSGGEIDATCVVQTDDGLQKTVKTTEITGTLVSEPSEIDAIALVQTANGKEKCVKTYSLGGGGGGGGGSTDGDYIMRVVDIDGTILKEEHLNEGDSFTLPEPPVHERLLFQQWVSPLTITDNTVTVPNQSVAIGPIYTTKSGKHEFDIHVNSHTGLTVTLNMNGTKEWGDGTTDTETSHTYAQAGSYTILCDGTKINGNLFNTAYNNVDFKCMAIRFAPGITGLSSNLPYLEGLRYISLSQGITDITSMLHTSTLLKSLVVPDTVKNCMGCLAYCDIYTLAYNGVGAMKDIGNGSNKTNMDFLYIAPNQSSASGSYYITNLANFYRIKRYVMPTSDVQQASFMYNYDLEEVVGFENTRVSALSGTFQGCRNLKEIKCPNVSSVGQNAFNGCYECLVYDFTKCTAVPTLQNINAFTGINPFAVIKVPASLYDSWIAASNWSNFAYFIVAV